MKQNAMDKKLRHYNKASYIQLVFCLVLAITFITSFTIILFSPMVQETFPEGGDSRKQVYMIFGVTVIGCWVFIVYALTLFLRFKSKEIGVLLALGAQKKQIAHNLSSEIRRIMFACMITGVIGDIILSFFIWTLMKSFFIQGNKYSYSITIYTIIIMAIFILIVAFTVANINKKYMKRTSILEFIYEQQKSETIKTVKIGYGICGLILTISGVILGYVVPIIIAYTKKSSLPGFWGITYLFSVIGIYMCIVYIVMGRRLGRNREKYYYKLISNSIMRFQGKQTVKNLCVITLMITAGLFAFFYIPQLKSGVNIYKQSEYDVSIPVRADEDVLNKNQLYKEAATNDVKIYDYKNVLFSELLGSGVDREWDNKGKLVEKYYKKYKYSEFISEDVFNYITDQKVNVKDGSYLLITSPESNESFWEKKDDLDCITNPESSKRLNVKFSGTVENVCLMRNGANRYVLSNNDYNVLSQGLSKSHKISQTMFSIKGSKINKYNFSIQLYKNLLKRAPSKMAVTSDYDEYQEALAKSQGKEYDYGEKLSLNFGNKDLMSYWKYYPIIKPIIEEQYTQSTIIFLAIFIYAGLICFVAVTIIQYTRVMTLSKNSSKLFIDLNRLGANQEYLVRCLTEQVRKIYVLPLCIGSIVMLLFTVIILRGNDNKFSLLDLQIFLIDCAIVVAFLLFQWCVFKFTMSKAKKVLNINT